MSSALVPVEINGETLYRVTVVREAVQPLAVEPPPSRPRSDSGPLAIVHGRFANPGPDWSTIHSPMEAQHFGIRGSSFLERIGGGAFDVAVARARNESMPKLLFQHGAEFEGKKPLGEITNIETTGHFSAQLFDVGYVRELLPALRSGAFGMSYKPRGVTRGELNRRPAKSDHNPRGIPEWTLRSVDAVAELSIVTFPADQNAKVAVKNVTAA
jgi:phage head maturation protease